MAFVAPLIAAAVGAGAVGTALISAGISLALGFAARALGPKPKGFSTGNVGHRLSLRIDPNAEREFAFGMAATAGTLVYHHVYGPNGNDFLQMVFALADHECESLEKVYVDGKPVTLVPEQDGSYTVSEYPGTMQLWFHSGAWDQAANTELVANSGGRWTSDDRGRGVCYVVARLKFNEKHYPRGDPKFLFVIKGAKLYDWRKDDTAGGVGNHRWDDPSTWEWTDNPAVILYNYRRGIRIAGQRVVGMNTPASSLPLADWTAAANACDELVPLKAGGTEKRYRAGGVISSAATHRDNIQDLLATMAAREVDSGGVIKLLPGASQVPVATVTDGDLMALDAVEIAPKRPRNELVNAIFGSFHDPAQAYDAVALPPRISSIDEAEDGGVRLEEHYALDFVPSGTQGQRVLEIIRRRARRQMTVKARFRSRLSVLEAGDWISWTSERYGWVGKTFEVASAQVDTDLTVTVLLRETDSLVYTWNPAVDELEPGAAEAPPAAPSLVNQVTGLQLAPVTVTGSGGAQRPGLQLTWTPIDDSTVDRIIIEYRAVGDAGALQVTVEDPSTGAHTWVNGVQGNLVYEARALPVCLPEREVEWSSWVTMVTPTEPLVIDVAAQALTVPPDTVTPAMLSPQARFELSLATALDSVQGSTQAALTQAWEWAQRAAESAIDGLINAQDARARVMTETIERATADAALAQQITTVQTTVGGHTTTIQEILESIDGLEAAWGVAIDVDGRVVGLVQLSGDSSQSSFTVVADKFLVAQPDELGGEPVPVFTISNVNGQPKLVFRGDMISDGSITVQKLDVNQLSSISANIGTVTAGKLQSADGKVVLDLDNKVFRMEN